MDKIHDLALVYAQVMFDKYVNSNRFSEGNIEDNLITLKGFYELAHNQLQCLEQIKSD